MSSVSLQGVRKAFDSTVVVEGADLSIEDGEFLVLVGPSGCGKSTTLNMIAGLESPSAGRILIGTRDVTRLPPKERNVAMVFQSYALYPHLSVADNIAFPLRMAGMAATERQRRVTEVAASLGLESLMKRRPRDLSGGQRQRVALARALVREPEVFLFDEPLSNLDAQLRAQMRTELKLLHQRLRTTVVYVTHDQVEAMTLGTRIVVMSAGRILQAAAPLEVYRWPATRFVAEFIGSPTMNFIEGAIHQQGTGLVFRAAQFSLALPPDERPPDHESPGSAVLGIRPEHLQLAAGPAEAARINGRIRVIEPLGSQLLLTLETDCGTLTALAPMEQDLSPGEPVRLAPDPRHLHLFAPGPHGARWSTPRPNA